MHCTRSSVHNLKILKCLYLNKNYLKTDNLRVLTRVTSGCIERSRNQLLRGFGESESLKF